MFSPIIHRNTPLPARYEQAYSTMHDDQKEVEIHVLQGERPEVHRNRSIGRFRLDLETGGGGRNKIVVRFDLTLDGTLKVTATQAATGLSRELTINNALSQFQADERNRAEARLEAMFGASDEMIDEEEGQFLEKWRQDKAEDTDPPEIAGDGTGESKFPKAVALLKKAESMKSSVQGKTRGTSSRCART